MSDEVKAIHAEADAVKLPPSVSAFPKLQKFAPVYTATARPAMLVAVSLLKLFHRGDAANAVAETVNVLDMLIASTQTQPEQFG